MSATLSFNPLTQCAAHLPALNQPDSLYYSCKRCIIKAVGLENLERIQDLPIPYRLKYALSEIGLGDFLIDAQNLPPECHTTRVYPAKCMLTGSPVTLKLVNSRERIDTSSSNFVTTFKAENRRFVVERKLQKLADVIAQCKAKGTTLKKDLIWSCLKQLVNYMIQKAVPATSHVSTDSITLQPNGNISVEMGASSDEMMPGPVYEAPEVLNNDNPDSRALVWSVGCILFEMLALEPAYHDPTGTNIFEVYMNITNGVIPNLPTTGRKKLKLLLKKCLVHHRATRISLQELKEMLDKA